MADAPVENLVTREKALVAGMDIRGRAERSISQLSEIAGEMRISCLRATDTEQRLAELAACRIDLAVDALYRNHIEEFRLREAIGIFLDGRMERSELRTIWRTWNDGPRRI